MARGAVVLGFVAAGALTLVTAAAPPNATPVSSVFGFVQSGDLKGLKATLAANPSSVNEKNAAGMTPLGFALSRKNTEASLALLEGGADPNTPFGPTHMHALQGAAARNLPSVVDALLSRGADPSGKDDNGGTALHEAVNAGTIDTASKIAGKGADVNAAYTAGPNAGATPVHLAAKAKNMLMIIVLAAHHPNWDLKWNGKTAAEVADDAGAKDVAEYIRSRQHAKP
jgi:ankyrin repeat protein